MSFHTTDLGLCEIFFFTKITHLTLPFHQTRRLYWAQILLRNRATKVNAQMHDGTTPLMLAVRLAVEGMVEELINADADVNASDAQGNIMYQSDYF